MENKLNILVVEDKEHHLEHVKSMLQRRIDSGVNINPLYERTYQGAIDKIDEVEGIITDIFIPRNEGRKPDSYGTDLIHPATRSGKHIVLCTDGWHHGPHLEGMPGYAWKRVPEGKEDFYLGMVDFVMGEDNSTKRVVEHPCKNWPRAYHTLMTALNPKEAEQFESHLTDLGIDTKSMLNGYWTPWKDMSKIFEGLDEFKRKVRSGKYGERKLLD